ncbi:nuclear transport factor 2 family protein [bacterium]|nr:nuclear transport factor 2 family protein [bacterium]
MEKDLNKVMDFFAEDAKLVTNEGTFEGEEEIKKYWRWMDDQFSEIKFEETELLVQGNKAAHEFVQKGKTVEEEDVEFPGIVIAEFSDGKIQEFRVYYDRLALAQQAAEGWIGKRMVNSVVGRMEEGLKE